MKIFFSNEIPDSPKGFGLICLDGLKHMEVMHESIYLSDTSISVFPPSVCENMFSPDCTVSFQSVQFDYFTLKG